MTEPRELARGRYLNSEFFFLERFKPTVRPMPYPNFSSRSRQLVQSLQAQSSLQVNLGRLVVIEDRGAPIPLEFESTLLEEALGEPRRVFTTDLELDGSFRKRAPEILEADRERCGSDENNDADDPKIPWSELGRH